MSPKDKVWQHASLGDWSQVAALVSRFDDYGIKYLLRDVEDFASVVNLELDKRLEAKRVIKLGEETNV